MKNLPTFFLSSTIYDFSDLRSSIKYFLEEQGCKVLASEYSDFDLNYEEHSYNECLENLQKADYFILLIGYRVGGYYSRDPNLSITNKEYREAYKQHKNGNLKIINFVRKEIFSIKKQRYELGKNLDNFEIDKIDKNKIKYYETNGFKDPKYIFDFIDEISKNEETKRATSSEIEFPTCNWIHLFANFEEIIDVLRPLVFDSLPKSDAINMTILKEYLRNTVGNMIFKFSDIVYTPKQLIGYFNKIVCNIFPPQTQENEDTILGTMKILKKDLGFITMPILKMHNKNNILVTDLTRIIQSDTFLTIDKDSGRLKPTNIYKLLIKLRNTIEKYNSFKTDNCMDLIVEIRSQKEPVINIKTIDFYLIYSLFKYWYNILQMIKSINNFLTTDYFSEPELLNYSMFKTQENEILKQNITDYDIDLILGR